MINCVSCYFQHFLEDQCFRCSTVPWDGGGGGAYFPLFMARLSDI